MTTLDNTAYWYCCQFSQVSLEKGIKTFLHVVSTCAVSRKTYLLLVDELHQTASQSFEGVCVLLRLTSCPFPVPDSQPTATELFQSPPFGSGTVFRSTSHPRRHFPSSALAWRHTSLNCVIHNTFVVPAKWHRHFGHLNRFYLLTYFPFVPLPVWLPIKIWLFCHITWAHSRSGKIWASGGHCCLTLGKWIDRSPNNLFFHSWVILKLVGLGQTAWVYMLESPLPYTCPNSLTYSDEIWYNACWE